VGTRQPPGGSCLVNSFSVDTALCATDRRLARRFVRMKMTAVPIKSAV
jgi:hypothetical protein